MEKEEFMSSLENEVFISAIDGFGIVVIVFEICRWRLVVDLSTFRPLTTVVIVVIGDVCKFAAETLQFSLCRVLVDFITASNLETRSHDIGW